MLLDRPHEFARLRAKRVLCATVATVIGTFALPATAMAQEPAQGQSGDASQDMQEQGLQEIVVTAQRRGENLQSVPISVSAATAEDLNTLGVRSTADITLIAPSVTFSTGPSAGSVTVRGVGGTGGGGDEPANAIYIDGVYLPSPSAAVFQFNNIERIEVLKGPQGTLFGRNAAGGLVHVITRAPSFDLTSSGEITYGSYDLMRASAYLSGGLSETIALSLSGIVEDQGKGWGRNLTTGREAYRGNYSALRGKVLWQPGDTTSVTAAALLSHVRPTGSQGTSLLPGQRDRSGGTNVGFYNVTTNVDTSSYTDQQNYALTIKQDVGNVVLTSITSRDIVTQELVGDQDLSRLALARTDIAGDNRSWTQELQLASGDASPVRWVFGLFYYHNDSQGSVKSSLSGATSFTQQLTDSYAAYGQATVPVTDTTNVTAGLRYTQDKRTLTGTSRSAAGVVTPLANQAKKDEKVTWRLAVDQKLGDDFLAYASYSRGFKSGLFNAAAPTRPAVEPQTADSWEIGFKSEFDRTLRLNVAAFHTDIEAIQVRGLFPGVPTAIFYNASGARITGAEAEANLFISSRLSLMANVAYLHARYKDGFTNALSFTVNPGPPYGLTQSTADASGNVAVNTPEWVASVSGRYAIPTAFGDVTFAGSYTYNDGYFFDPQNRVGSPAFHLVNASVEVALNEGVSLRAWANNLLDERYYSVVNSSPFGDGYLPQAPRTYGVSFAWSFN